MSRVVIALVVAAGLAAPQAAPAQSRWREQVNVQIDQAAKLLRERGFEKTDTYDGSLNHDASESVIIPLRAGRQYAVLAVCDNDCTDLDLRLYNSDDKELAADIETDDAPVVTIAPERDGKYRLKITMAKCTSSPCFYGVGLFAK